MMMFYVLVMSFFGLSMRLILASVDELGNVSFSSVF